MVRLPRRRFRQRSRGSSATPSLFWGNLGHPPAQAGPDQPAAKPYAAGSMGEGCALLILLAAAYLLITKTANWRLMLSGLVGFVLANVLFRNVFGFDADDRSGVPPLLFNLLAGTTLYVLVFMVTDPRQRDQAEARPVRLRRSCRLLHGLHAMEGPVRRRRHLRRPVRQHGRALARRRRRVVARPPQTAEDSKRQGTTDRQMTRANRQDGKPPIVPADRVGRGGSVLLLLVPWHLLGSCSFPRALFPRRGGGMNFRPQQEPRLHHRLRGSRIGRLHRRDHGRLRLGQAHHRPQRTRPDRTGHRPRSSASARRTCRPSRPATSTPNTSSRRMRRPRTTSPSRTARTSPSPWRSPSRASASGPRSEA